MVLTADKNSNLKILKTSLIAGWFSNQEISAIKMFSTGESTITSIFPHQLIFFYRFGFFTQKKKLTCLSAGGNTSNNSLNMFALAGN